MPTDLTALLRPQSVALIGASPRPGSVGAVVMRNLRQGGFEGPMFPVNPKHRSVAGAWCWPDVASLPIAPDLAVVCTPPATVPGVIAALGERGVRAAVVLTAGLRPGLDSTGKPLDQAMLEAARRHGLRILGPNCVGLLIPPLGLNASFAHLGAARGSLAFVSQSGGLCTAVLDYAAAHGIGFSVFASLGDALDIGPGDLIEALGRDPGTSGILLYLESLPNARKLLAAARTVARDKPILAIKAGRVPEGAAAAASHTGAMAGADEVVADALRRAGILRVNDVHELFAAVETLARARPLTGDRLAIVTNSGGPGVLATDALVALGGQLAELRDETRQKLGAFLPATASLRNPVDIIGDASPQRFAQAIRTVAADPSVGAVCLLWVPTAVTTPFEAAHAAAEAVRELGMPVLACWLGPAAAREAEPALAAAGIASYATPGDAVAAFLHLVQHRHRRETLTQATPPPRSAGASPARSIIERALRDERSWLTEAEAKQVLAAFGIPVVATAIAADAENAAAQAVKLGFPVAVKILSHDVLHKSDVGGVALDLPSADAVRAAASSMAVRLHSLLPKARLDGFTVAKRWRGGRTRSSASSVPRSTQCWARSSCSAKAASRSRRWTTTP